MRKHFQKILLSLGLNRLRYSSSPGQGRGETYYFLSTLRSTEVINKNLFPKFSNNLRNTFLRNKNLKMKLFLCYGAHSQDDYVHHGAPKHFHKSSKGQVALFSLRNLTANLLFIPQVLFSTKTEKTFFLK